MAEITPNEITKALENQDNALGPKMTISLVPVAYETHPKLRNFILAETRLICAMLQMFFAMQGLTKVSIVWENLQSVRKPGEVPDS